jgi:hypothetical protein
MRVLLLGVLCIAACGGDKRAAPRPEDAAIVRATPPDAARVDDVSIDASVDALAISEEWVDPLARFHDVPLAMVAKDGSAVLLRIIDPDGARAAPNLALELRDRRDRKTARVDVLKLDEEPSTQTLEKRAAAADELIKKHAMGRLTELVGDREAGRFQGDNVVVVWKNQHVTIKQLGKTVVDRDVPAAWLHKPYFEKHEGITCKNPAFLRAVFVSAANKLAVVEIAYSGTDSCWAPSPQLHVLAW